MYTKEQQVKKHGKVDKGAIDAAFAALRKSRERQFVPQPTPVKPKVEREPQVAPKVEHAAESEIIEAASPAAEPEVKVSAPVEPPVAAAAGSAKRGRPRKRVSELMKERGIGRAEAEAIADSEGS